MSEVVEALKPLPNLKDMASSSYYFQTMQADRASSSPNGKNGLRTQGSFSRNGLQHPRSLSIPNEDRTPTWRQCNANRGEVYQVNVYNVECIPNL
ncbi:UNVERIFIED_CONTAM: putative serine/threonine-protein kinase PIX7 [Sesamum latifolium]|uniref:Serine/threonine-protein kinase PIX7 n=1 Tax=Sesamum latifolium TaxID=2727402 RepID=A0AAW2UVK6_9LAMI